MQLSLQTKSQIIANMTATIQGAAASGGFTISMNPGSAMLAFVNACAGTYLWLQWLAAQVLSAARLATCSGSDCDLFCADFGFVRIAGTAASGQVTFARYSAGQQAVVPVGSTIKTTDGTQSFVLVADTGQEAYLPSAYAYIIPVGVVSITATVQNSAVGVAGNIIAGALGLVTSNIPYVDTVTNAAAFSNGMNVESDTAMKLRFSLFLTSLAKATPIALQSAVLGVAQNLTCAVLSGAQTVGGPFAPGYGVIAVDDGTGATPSATLAAIVTAATGPSMLALGAVCTVVQAPVIAADVALTITCATSVQKAAALPLVTAAVSAYIGALPVSTSATPAPLPYSALFKIAYGASANVSNVTGVTVNGGTADIGGAAGTVVRAGTVTVS
jgi:Baseplate J-like protein